MPRDIKSFAPNPRSQFDQGYYPLNECRKYRGRGPIVYRSSWERMFCDYCERTPAIQWWSSEAIGIPYYNPFDGKDHLYFPDFLLGMEDGTVVIAEVKPSFALRKPRPPRKKTAKSLSRYKRDLDNYRMNALKVMAARKYAEEHNARFMLVTEKFFKPTAK